MRCSGVLRLCYGGTCTRDAFISRGVIARSCVLRKTHCALNFLQVTCCCMHVMWHGGAAKAGVQFRVHCVRKSAALAKKAGKRTASLHKQLLWSADNEVVYLFESSIECGTTKFRCEANSKKTWIRLVQLYCVTWWWKITSPAAIVGA